MQVQTGLRIVGSRSSPQTRRLLEFAVRNRLPHVWLDTDTDTDPAAGVVLAHRHTPVSQTPVVVMRGGELLRQPSNAELARAAGIGTGPVAGMTYDVAIIGAGPAGLAAAVYGASEGLSTALVDALAVGGQIGTTSRIENYLGFPVGISGGEFAERAYIQVLRFGASVVRRFASRCSARQACPAQQCRAQLVPKSYASRPRGGLGPRVAHGPVERVVRHLFPAVLGEGVVGAVGVLLELGERARLLLDVVGGARDHCGHGVVLAVGQEQQRRAA
jgi:hypothetical protein